MFNLSLTACSFNLMKPYSRNAKESYYLNAPIEVKSEADKNIETQPIRFLFETFFRAYANTISDDERRTTFSIEYKDTYHGETEHFNYFYVVIHSGIYGSTSDITNVITREVTHKMTADEAPERPFYLFIVVPKDNDDVTVQKGMLFFQNIGSAGVKTITTDLMTKLFSNRFGISFKSSTISAELFIRTIMKKENIRKLTMVKNHLSDDATDRISKGYGSETRTIANFHFNDTMWDKLFEKIDYCAKGRFNLFEFENVAYDTLKVLVTIGDRDRTVDVHNIENLSIIEGIPDEIRMADGLPNKDALLEHFIKVANDYLNELVLQIK